MRAFALLVTLAACGDDGGQPCAPAVPVPDWLVAGDRCDVWGEPYGASCVQGGRDGFDPSVAMTASGFRLRTWKESTSDGAALLAALDGPAACHAPRTIAPSIEGWYHLVGADDHFRIAWEVAAEVVEVALSEQDEVTRVEPQCPSGEAEVGYGARRAAVIGGELEIEQEGERLHVPLGEFLASPALAADAEGIVVSWRRTPEGALGVARVAWDGRIVSPSRTIGEGSPRSATITADGTIFLTTTGEFTCGGNRVDLHVLDRALAPLVSRHLGATAWDAVLASHGDEVWVALESASLSTTADVRIIGFGCQVPTFLRVDQRGEILARETPGK